MAQKSQTHKPCNRAVQCGDRRHKASVARQRANTVVNPIDQAEAMVRLIRKRIADGQPLPGPEAYRNLSDDFWCEFLYKLDDHELELFHRSQRTVDVEQLIRARVDARTVEQVKRVYGPHATVIETERLNDVLEAIAAKCETVAA